LCLSPTTGTVCAPMYSMAVLLDILIGVGSLDVWETVFLLIILEQNSSGNWEWAVLLRPSR
jgi:hypothetical protein